MHIPDGFLAAKVLIPAWAVSAGTLAYSLRKATVALKERTIPLMGVTAAFIFIVQLVDFPVFAGTSGHLLGGALTAILLGPYAAVIVLTCVLLAQSFILQDGGITALGANILNIAIFGTIGAYIPYKLLRAVTGKHALAIFVSTCFSVILAAAGCAMELSASGVSPFKITLPAMVFTHMLTGIIEGIITVLIINFVAKIRPDIILGKRDKN
jgi:cobalt/nickel transport system permease protein